MKRITKKWPWIALSAVILIIILSFVLYPVIQKALHRPDENGFYRIDDFILEDLGETNQKSLDYFVRKMNTIADNQLTDQNRVFYSVIPDKAFYTQDSGYPVYDYQNLFTTLENGMPSSFQYIDITNDLNLESFYQTDSHWRQEKLFPVVNHLAQEMGFTPLPESAYEKEEVLDYRGGYSVLTESEQTETLYYLTSDTTRKASVYNNETGLNGNVYDIQKLSSDIPYNVFLSGPTGFLRIECPNAATDKELIIFRDSYGSSITPLLLGDYKTVTVIDLRYLPSAYLSDYVTFTDQDVLFLYSAFMINKSMTIR